MFKPFVLIALSKLNKVQRMALEIVKAQWNQGKSVNEICDHFYNQIGQATPEVIAAQEIARRFCFQAGENVGHIFRPTSYDYEEVNEDGSKAHSREAVADMVPCASLVEGRAAKRFVKMISKGVANGFTGSERNGMRQSNLWSLYASMPETMNRTLDYTSDLMSKRECTDAIKEVEALKARLEEVASTK